MMISVREASNAVCAVLPETKTETIPLSISTGRVLCETVSADRDYPPINRATMDGIAICAPSWEHGVRAWTIEQIWAAGTPTTHLRDPLHGCAQIMTGASVPDNADGVIPFEQLDIRGPTATVHAETAFTRGQNIHAKSTDRKQGDVLLKQGVLLDAPRIAIMGSVGHAHVKVAVPPRVALLSTGDEIVPVDSKDIDPTHVRASNLLGLEAALRLLGISSIHARHVPDQRDTITNAISESLADYDILILSGGVSMGKFDYVPEALALAGVEKIFHGVAQKPGKPFWFGRTPSCRAFGLPGNPVSTLTVFRRYVAPYIQQSMGMNHVAPHMVRCRTELRPHPRLTTFPPVMTGISERGQHVAEPVTYHGSGDFAALAESQGFIEVPAGDLPFPKDSAFPFYPWRVI